MSVSWLLQGLSQPDSRRDWRPRPRSVTPGGALDDAISSEPGTPQFGKSILLLPTAASSDSFWSEIQFRETEIELLNELLNLCHTEKKRHSTHYLGRIYSPSLMSCPTLPDGKLTCCLCARWNSHASPSTSLTYLAACDMAADASTHPC